MRAHVLEVEVVTHEGRPAVRADRDRRSRRAKHDLRAARRTVDRRAPPPPPRPRREPLRELLQQLGLLRVELLLREDSLGHQLVELLDRRSHLGSRPRASPASRPAPQQRCPPPWSARWRPRHRGRLRLPPRRPRWQPRPESIAPSGTACSGPCRRPRPCRSARRAPSAAPRAARCSATWKSRARGRCSANIGRSGSCRPPPPPARSWLAAMSRKGMLLSAKCRISTATIELRSCPSRSPTV